MTDVTHEDVAVDRESGGKRLAAADRLISEPRRQAILYVIEGGQKADYALLQRVTGLSMGGLATHLGRLEEAGFIEVRKEFVLRKPKTWVLITPEGKEAVEGYHRRQKEIWEGRGGEQHTLFESGEEAS